MNISELTIALCSAPGPSGFEDAATELVRREIAPFVDETKIDSMGNLIAVKRCGKPGAKSLLLEAHIDEIGLIVTGYEKGFLRFSTLGGIDPRMLPAREIKVLTEQPIYGIIDVMPIHALTAEEMSKSLPVDKLYIDIGMSEEEAKAAVPLGTPCVYAEGAFKLGEGSICGKALDDRSCAAIIVKTVEELAAKELDVDLYCLFSVQEEVGGRGAIVGAFGIAPDYAIALDVTFGKTPDIPSHKCLQMGGGAAIGWGPNFNRSFTQKIIDKAKEKELPYQLEVISGHSGTDAWAMQIVRDGIACALVSLPIKYMHSPVETMYVSDAENIIELLTAFIAEEGEVL